ncbi:cation:proton antiporter [Bacteriovorax sp. DB6_IX]|uniref:cation:proton antiporter domain-containing protein n=1 Tax=Bacteriovorax sp. DB6_IX TaxID=1353530 RepID=UPI000389E181|nr:cation:proton antiporter [Bacteriovorax sp. DB6_IX]EQC52442.1 transporter, CPA2 family [Bacteriovorax sp. DB6_IX]
MFQESILLDIFYYLVATVALVPICKTLGLGNIFGYLMTGILLGPACFGLLSKSHHIEQISDFGIIMLLFVIGLELSPSRLKKLRGIIFKEGMAQFIVTSGILCFFMTWYGYSLLTSVVVSSSLSLSSTAFALYYLKESDQLTKSYGHSSFSILLFQDLIIIPILTILPFFAESSQIVGQFDYRGLFLNIIMIMGALIFGKFALIPAISWMYQSQSKEIFISSCLLLIVGASLLMDHIGLSKALGSFMAGIFLTNSKFRTEISSFSVPLKSMLMGVFFMAFGLSIDMDYFRENITHVILVTTVFTLTKTVVLTIIGRVKSGRWSMGFKMGLLLGQGGEFGLLIIATATELFILNENESNLFISAVTLSIFMSPFFSKIVDYLNERSPGLEESFEEQNQEMKQAS